MFDWCIFMYLYMFVVDLLSLSIQPKKNSLNLIKPLTHEHFKSNDRQLARPTELYILRYFNQQFVIAHHRLLLVWFFAF